MFYSLDDEQIDYIFSDEKKESLVRLNNQIGTEDDVALDSKMLQKALNFARQKLHTIRFNNLCQSNDFGKWLEIGRPWFIGNAVALRCGDIGLAAILSEWASNPRVLSAFVALQKNNARNVPDVYIKLYDHNRNTLSCAHGNKLKRALAEAVEQAFCPLKKRKNGIEFDPSFNVPFFLTRAWKEYISTTIKVTYEHDLSEGEKDNYLREEIQRLFCGAINDLLVLVALDW